MLQATALVAPLDWGLGHATRCIPIIKELLVQNYKVVIAASGAPADLLKSEFPDLEILTIDNYNIRYSKKKSLFALKLLSQFPKIITAIRKEHHWLIALLSKHKIDFVISDNRPGLYTQKVPCFYITHQLNIKTGHAITDRLARQMHRYFIKKFTECWIPDAESGGLSGQLSHPLRKNIRARYINPISRFEITKEAVQPFDIAILLSGPEPQRTMMEKLILPQIKNSLRKIILVRGLPAGTTPSGAVSNAVVVNHLKADELNKVLCGATLVISRSGYTSVMDFVKLKKKAVLIPTPGQTEQEYLATFLEGKGIFMASDQSSFDLEIAWNQAQSFQPHFPETSFNQFKKTIQSLKTKFS